MIGVRIFRFIKRIRFRYILKRSKVIVEKGGRLEVAPQVDIVGSSIYVASGAVLKIGSKAVVKQCDIFLSDQRSTVIIGQEGRLSDIDLFVCDGRFSLGDFSILENSELNRKLRVHVRGICDIGSYNRIRSSILVRFLGRLDIGSRNVVNERSEIRCDEKITIGDYNQISYDCDIWDTNTHCFYPPEKRRELTDSQYPGFGEETEKPDTVPVAIGSDCWIGKGCAILKGSLIADRSVLGYGTLISGKHISPDSKVIAKSVLHISRTADCD